jgi:hypothetical protein
MQEAISGECLDGAVASNEAKPSTARMAGMPKMQEHFSAGRNTDVPEDRRHSRESGNPCFFFHKNMRSGWIPAFAGMTSNSELQARWSAARLTGSALLVR